MTIGTCWKRPRLWAARLWWLRSISRFRPRPMSAPCMIATWAAAAALSVRPARWGFGAFGPEGVQRVIEILQAELVQAMAHTGRASLDAIDRSLVRTDFQ